MKRKYIMAGRHFGSINKNGTISGHWSEDNGAMIFGVLNA